jgi:hypothetical protein
LALITPSILTPLAIISRTSTALDSKKDIIITSDQSINIYTPESVEEEKATESNSSPESNSNSESNNYFYANNIDINAGKKVEIAYLDCSWPP